MHRYVPLNLFGASSTGSNSWLPARAFSAAVTLAFALLATGCSNMAVGKHPAAFSSAATLVVDNSSSAYRAAIDLHDQEQVSAGVLTVEDGKPWDYNQLTPLITPEGLKTRIQILDGLKTYAQSLSDVAAGVESPALTAAAKSTASDLNGLGSRINTQAGGDKSGLTLSTESANAASTALLALGEYLASKKANTALPGITAQMDLHIQTLCKILTDDIDTIRKQSKKDYEDLSRQEWTFIQVNREKLSPLELRDEIEKLPSYRKSEQTTDEKLADLQTNIGKLATAHHDLEMAAQAKDPEALSAKIADLEAVGSKLGIYYQSLSAKSSTNSGSSSDSSASSSTK